MKRRFLTALLVALLVLCLLPVAARAAQTLDQLIVQACVYDTETDVSVLEVQPAELDSRFHSLLAEGSLPWYTTGNYTYSYDTETGQVLTFQPDNLDREQYDYSRYEQRLDEILAETVHEGMSRWQIALAVHDYLVANYAYDETLERRTGYDLLMGGRAVCAGYAEAYQQLLLRAGVPCVTVSSETMEHQWNLVQIGDDWYHVDVTWDDPASNIQGYVSHQYFLLTDAEIRSGEKPHHDWAGGRECTSSVFSNGFWRDVHSAIIYTGPNQCYLIRENWDCRRLVYLDNGNETILWEDADVYIDMGDGNCSYSHFGLSLRDSRLWVTDSVAVYSMYLDGSDPVAVYTHDYAADSRHILGCHVSEDKLYLTLRTHEDDRADTTFSLPPVQHHVHSYTETVVLPSCTVAGKTNYVCACGISGECEPVPALHHDYQVVADKRASFFGEGYARYVCTRCGAEETQTIPKISFSEWLGSLNINGILMIVGITCVAAGLLLELKDRRGRKTGRNRER